MLTVVTAVDDLYVPGAVALYNSIVRNTPPGEIDFYCLYFGENPEELISKGINVISNPAYPDDVKFPVGGRWASAPGYPDGLNPSRYAMPAMYARLLMTKLFPDRDRIFWVDADCIVLKSIADLETVDFKGTVVAGIDISNAANGNFNSLYPIKGCNGNNLGHRAFGCGVMLVNVAEWEREQITEKCFELMRTCEQKKEMLAVVQSILILVVKNNFVSIQENEYLFSAKRADPPASTKIIHFPIMIPWDEYNMKQKPELFWRQVEKHWNPYR